MGKHLNRFGAKGRATQAKIHSRRESAGSAVGEAVLACLEAVFEILFFWAE